MYVIGAGGEPRIANTVKVFRITLKMLLIAREYAQHSHTKTLQMYNADYCSLSPRSLLFAFRRITGSAHHDELKLFS
jgi:hypothetical protein